MKPLPVWSLPAIAAGLVGLTLAALLLHVPGELGIGSDTRLTVFVGLAGLACLLHAGATGLVLHRMPGPRLIWGILAVAAVLRLLVALSPAFLSSDLYRYVWDGRVQAAGINPYLYIPADPALASLRESAIFPHINRADYAPTIYPPVAQMIFLAVASISQTAVAMKLAMTLFDGLAIVCIMRLLRAASLPRERVLIYAWHPLPLWEFAGNAHVDIIAIAMILLALLATVGRRSTLAGAALAGAVLVKFLPAVLLPAIWCRWDWRFVTAFGATIVAAYLCYLGAGWRVFGFLSGYANEEGIATGSGLYPVSVLSRLLPLPQAGGKIYLALLAAGLGALALTMLVSRADASAPRRMAGRALALMTVLTAGISPHYPWYFCWLLPLSCLVPLLSVLYLVSAGFLIYLDPIHTDLLWPSVVYVPFAALAVRDLLRMRPGHGRL